MPHRNFFLTTLAIGTLVALTSILLKRADLSFESLNFSAGTHLNSTGITTSVDGFPTSNVTMPRTPVYFISHGGPNLMDSFNHPAYHELRKIGREITQKVKPKAVVVFSAHWAGEPTTIEVNTATSMPLVYDYYGFPPHYYEVQYPNEGSPELAENVIGKIRAAGMKAEGVRRGLDHGVYIPFLVMFDPKTNPLGVPIVSASLFDSDDGEAHVKLGEAIAGLRDEDILVIVSGTAVHNLRELWRMSSGETAPYAVTFDEALREAVETKDVASRREKTVELLKRKDARKAHPSFEHLLPVHIGVGAAKDDVGVRTWTMLEGSLSWAQIRFGEVQAAGA